MANLPEKEQRFFPEQPPAIEEVGLVPETRIEQEGYIERVEKELKSPILDDYGQPIITASTSQKPKIILPIREEPYLNPKNWHKPITEAIRWLLLLTRRIISMRPGRTVFRE